MFGFPLLFKTGWDCGFSSKFVSVIELEQWNPGPVCVVFIKEPGEAGW